MFLVASALFSAATTAISSISAACMFLDSQKVVDSSDLSSILAGLCSLAIIGYILLISTTIPAAQYVGTFLAACGVYPMIPISVMWNGNNIGGSTKRGVGIAMHIGFGNCGGVIASFV